MLRIINSVEKGRCVIADRDYKAGEIIETNHIIEIPVGAMKNTDFDQFPMSWTDDFDCIALGPINLLNHSETSNGMIEDNFPERTKRLLAKVDISKGEEVTIHYCCDCWFNVVV